MYYIFPLGHSQTDGPRTKAFCEANGINPRAPLHGSNFELTDTDELLTREFEFVDGQRVWHTGCCGTDHWAKTSGRYPLQAAPEQFGFQPLRLADGSVAR